MNVTAFEHEQARNYLRKDLSRAFEECFNSRSLQIGDTTGTFQDLVFGPKGILPQGMSHSKRLDGDQITYITPEKDKSTEFSANKNLTHPETFFTPLKVPCSSRNDTLEESNPLHLTY